MAARAGGPRLIHCEVREHYPPLANFEEYMLGQWWRVVSLDVNNRVTRLRHDRREDDEDHDREKHCQR